MFTFEHRAERFDGHVDTIYKMLAKRLIRAAELSSNGGGWFYLAEAV